jgi:hypothetical protein
LQPRGVWMITERLRRVKRQLAGIEEVKAKQGP